MAGSLNEARKKIRDILKAESVPVIELGRIMPLAGNLDTVVEAAQAERKSQKNRTREALLSNLIASVYLESNMLDEAEKEALNISDDQKMPHPIRAFAYCLLAWVYIRREDYAHTEDYCRKALAFTEKNQNAVLVHVFNVTGSVNYYQQKYPLALEYFQLYQQASEKIGSKTQLVGALHNVAITLMGLGRETEALDCVQQSKQIALEMKDSLRLGYALNTLGNLYLNAGRPERALPETREALRIFEEAGHRRMFADCHIDLGRIHLESGDLDAAAEHAARALQFAEELEQKSNLPRIHELMGLVLASQENPLAGTHFARSIEFYRKLGPDAGGIEFALFEYGRYLSGRDSTESSRYLQEAARILSRKPATAKVRRTLAKIESLQKSTGLRFYLPEDDSGRREKEHEDLRRILEITKAINSETELGNLLERILGIAIETSGAERGFIALADEEQWKYEAACNFTGPIDAEPDYLVIREIVEKVISEGRLFTAGDISRSEILSAFVSRQPSSLKGIFVFPLAIKDKVLGAVYLDNRFAVVDLPQDAVRFMVTLMEQAALVIEKTALYEEIRSLNERLGEKLERTRSDLERKQHELEVRFSYKNIVGKSKRMQQVFELLDRVIQSDLPVFIQGESGTGKELVAKAIHYNGPRKRKHFVAVNCAAIPETLLESELFGYEKGAFTGADSIRRGLFEIADGGTFFLDEVSNMSPSMQQKLLRAIQEKEIRRIGGKKHVSVNVRLISASNRDPRDMVKAGELREDLFYRLNVLPVALPPLRERKEDIPLLVEYFWEKATGGRFEVSEKDKQDLLMMLMSHDWPGNVRELENEIYSLASTADDGLNLNHLPRHLLERSEAGISPAALEGLSIRDMEKMLIVEALKKTKGNKSRAAGLLGIPRTSLNNKIRRYQIQYQ
jgi:Nif-specific regulatory protein